METLKVKFSYPWPEACERLKQDALSRSDYDPASLFRWGNMMAMSVIRMLQAVEREIGAEGQRAMLEALVEVGREVGRQSLEGVELPEGVEPIEFISSYASWINREIYASPEDPRIDSADQCSFDILWCPHQDSYRAFDCRVQRYLVQGMMEAMREKFAGADFDVKVVRTIPAGSKVCTFEVWRKREGGDGAWEQYSDSLADKALELAGRKQ
jgi:hypothetical protein